MSADQPSPRTGDVIPDFQVRDSGGAPVELSELLTEGPLVLVTYRGYW